MADIDRLPMGWRDSMTKFATASEAVRNMLLAGHPDWHVVYSNFLGDALPSEWAAAKVDGSPSAATVASSQLVLTTDDDSGDYAGQAYGLFWKGDWGVYFESQQSLDVLATSKIEVGLTDAIGDAGAVATKATPTGTADDFCVLVRDTTDNTELDVISEIDDGGPSADAEDVHTVAAATDFTSIFVAQNDVVQVRVGSTYSNAETVGAGAMQGGDLVTPWWFVQTRGTVVRVLTVDYFVCAGPNS